MTPLELASFLRHCARSGFRDLEAAAMLESQAAEIRTLRNAIAAEQPPAPAEPLSELQALRGLKDSAYLERNRCVALIARMALTLGCRAGLARTAIEGWSDDWHGCVYIDLPTGQVSWHFHDSQLWLFDDLPPYAGTWDGHDTPTKYDRVFGAFPAAVGVAEPLSESHGLDNDRQVFFYEQDFYVLSNFSAFQLDFNGLTFQTSEHAYQYMKFVDRLRGSEREWVAQRIFAAPSAHEAFKVAEENRRVRRTDWDEVKVDIMREILHTKAEQHEYVRRKLLATGDRELIDNSWRDDFWGWGPNRDGQNMLGKLWMEIRTELRAGVRFAEQRRHLR